jgi:hypothetical protein
MALLHVTLEEAVKRLAQLPGDAPNSIESLCELVRAEVHARQHAPRAAMLSRVARLLAPAMIIEEHRLDEVCDALEREGDVVLATGGIIHATPTRVVALKKSARIFSSLPTRTLAEALGREVYAKGATRSVVSVDRLAEAVATISGAMVTPEAWAGVDRTPPADATFLAKLEQRLEWQALGAGSLEKDSALEWRTWQSTPEGLQWRRNNEGRLWWARTRFGGHYRAWTASGSPSTSPFVELNPDDADRARFALSREVAGASVLLVVRSDKRATLEFSAWLPRPEYRWLSLHAEPLPNSKGLRWQIAAHEEAMITKLLTERLGLVVEAT